MFMFVQECLLSHAWNSHIGLATTIMLSSLVHVIDLIQRSIICNSFSREFPSVAFRRPRMEFYSVVFRVSNLLYEIRFLF